MPRLRPNQAPSYRLHKQSGQAVVTFNGRDVLLGPHGSPESREKYDRLVAEWFQNGRDLPTGESEGVTVSVVIAAFWSHAERYYQLDGGPAGELDNFRHALRHREYRPRVLFHDTISSFKGCEADVVILHDVHGQGKNLSLEDLYVACSRPRAGLFIFRGTDFQWPAAATV